MFAFAFWAAYPRSSPLIITPPPAGSPAGALDDAAFGGGIIAHSPPPSNEPTGDTAVVAWGSRRWPNEPGLERGAGLCAALGRDPAAPARVEPSVDGEPSNINPPGIPRGRTPPRVRRFL